MNLRKISILGSAALLAAGVLGSGLVTEDSAEARPLRPRVYPAGACKAVDGDTIRCRDERIRLAEIDAPEMPGHCRANRVCAPGDPFAAKAALSALVQGEVRVRRYGSDRYGRTIADVRINGVSASCTLIKGGYAMLQLKWADYGATRKCR